MNVIIGKENNALKWTKCSSYQGALIKCRILSNLVLIIWLMMILEKKRSDLTTKEEPTKNKSTNCLKYSYLKIFKLKGRASFVFRK